MASFNEMAENIVKLIGGKENVKNAWHCATRLRFNLHDNELVKIEEIKKISGVMGAQFSGSQLQIIIGNKVSNVFEEIEKLTAGGGNAGKDGKSSDNKEGIVSRLMDLISGIFTPILPALAGAGLLKGFIALFVTFGWLNPEDDTYAILNAIGDGLFYFLPFFLAVSAARKVKVNEFLALSIAAVLLYPTLTDAARGITEVNGFSLFGLDFINIPVINYASSVIPIILSVFLLKYVHKFINAWMPSSISLMFTPMLTLLIVVPITLWLIGPLGTNVGNGLSGAFAWMFEHTGPLAGLLMAGLFPVIVMTGMHYAFAPIAIQNLTTYGYDNIISPMNLISNAAQGGAALAVAVRTKNKEMKQLATSSGVSALIGITEPAMYGVNMKLKKPFYMAMVSSGVLGAIAAWYGLKAFTMGGLPGMFSLPTFASSDGSSMNLIVAISLFIAAIILPFILVLIFGFEDIESEEEDKEVESTDEKPITDGSIAMKTVDVLSPLEGEIVPLKSVPDKVFADEIMGKGIAIEPKGNRLVSPISGTVMVLPDSQHAVGIQSDDGQEIMIHIGIDTVSLNGKHFKGLVKINDHVEVGQPLIEFDCQAIKEEGFETVTMIIVTNTNNYLDVLPANETGIIFEGEQLLSVVK